MKKNNKSNFITENKIVPVNKNEEYIVKIIDYGANGEGIAKIDGYTIFVLDGMKGEKCKIHITKVLSSQAYAKIIEIIESSSERVIPDCPTYKRCGGCALRHIAYEETLKIKQGKVQNLVNKMLETKTSVNETIGMELPMHYRNKAIFPINQSKQVGIFALRSHEIIPIEECMIQTKISQEISKYIVQNWNDTIYDEQTGKGVLRNIMIREGFKTHEIMVVLVQNSKSINKNALDLEKLLKKFPMIKTVALNINTENTNVVLSTKNIILYGDGYITDKLGDYIFKISPNSFYQVNPIQTEKIYNLAISEAELKDTDVICDLYCGIGTIGIFASKYVKKVYGVEIVEEAIDDAKENAKLNNTSNIEFFVGDVEKVFSKMINELINSSKKQHELDSNNEKKGTNIIENTILEKPNVVFVDPPRKGLDNITIQNLCSLRPEKIVYISCNPATLMRDLHSLESEYNIKSITPIDNFPYSPHVETVVSLEQK